MLYKTVWWILYQCSQIVGLLKICLKIFQHNSTDFMTDYTWELWGKYSQNHHIWSFLIKKAIKNFFLQNLLRLIYWKRKVKKCLWSKENNSRGLFLIKGQYFKGPKFFIFRISVFFLIYFFNVILRFINFNLSENA